MGCPPRQGWRTQDEGGGGGSGGSAEGRRGGGSLSWMGVGRSNQLALWGTACVTIATMHVRSEAIHLLAGTANYRVTTDICVTANVSSD